MKQIAASKQTLARGGGATGQRGHPSLMTIGRSPAGYQPVRSRDDALRPMGPDADHAWRLLLDIKRAWRDAPRGLKDSAEVPYSLARAMRAARITKRSVGGMTYRERIATLLRWLDTQGTIQFTEGDNRWSILLQTTPAEMQYNPIGEWRYESQQQASELLVLWQRIWAERWLGPYRWPPERPVWKDDGARWINEVTDSQRFLADQLDCGVAYELIAQVYLAYITGHVQWKASAPQIPIYNQFKWHGGRPKPVGLTTCHTHFDRLLRDVRDAIEVQANALDQDPPSWLDEQPDEVDRRVVVTSAKIIRRARRLRAAGKPAPTDEQARAIAVRRNQPAGTRVVGEEHYEAVEPRRSPLHPRRCPMHGDGPRNARCAGCN